MMKVVQILLIDQRRLQITHQTIFQFVRLLIKLINCIDKVLILKIV